MTFEHFLVACILVLIAAKIGGEIAERFKQPAVLGELLAGILVGPSVLGHAGFIPLFGPTVARLAIDHNSPILSLLAEVGAVLLLFEAGLDADLEELRRLGLAALWVAVVGVALPFGLGYLVAHQMGLNVTSSVFMGAALTATSVGITARTFTDLKLSNRPESKIVLGAAVADDVLGLVILAIVSGLAGGAATGAAASAAAEPAKSPFVVVISALLFLVGSLVGGFYLAPVILRFAARMRTRAALATVALIMCFSFSALAHIIGGLAPIVGAFAAGLVLAQTKHKLHFEAKLKPVADLFMPFFFVLMGASMPIEQINPATAQGRATLLLGGGLLVVAIFGKVMAGLTIPMKNVSRLLIGVGMVPRGEVGLIFASVGLAKNLITPGLFSAVVLMVMFTTLLTPPFLQIIAGREKKNGDALPVPGDSTAVPTVSR